MALFCVMSYMQNVLLIFLCIFLCCFSTITSTNKTIIPEDCLKEATAETNSNTFRPDSPLVLCCMLPDQFIDCEDPIDLDGNATAREELGYGCTKWGGDRYEDIEVTPVNCTVLPDIECYGNRTFIRDGVPCIKYTRHYFVTTLIYSVLLGFLGMDRFCLGHTGSAVGKLLTLGGFGVWWIVDVVLLVTGGLKPQDGSNWIPYY